MPLRGQPRDGIRERKHHIGKSEAATIDLGCCNDHNALPDVREPITRPSQAQRNDAPMLNSQTTTEMLRSTLPPRSPSHL